jgi:hypothetical protein
VSYVLLVDELERRSLVALIVGAIAKSVGANVELANPVDERAAFDAALAAEPRQQNADELLLLQELGLREVPGGDAR